MQSYRTARLSCSRDTGTLMKTCKRVSRLANALADLGVGPGDRVASMQVNTNQVIETYFAAAALDAIYVPFNFRPGLRKWLTCSATPTPRRFS